MAGAENGLGGTSSGKLIPRRDRVLIALALVPDRLILEEAVSRGWQLVNLYYSDLPPGVVPRGALVSDLPDSKRVCALREWGVPVVRLGNLPHPDDDKVPVILHDRVAEGRLAADHFAERGFRNVGFFGRDPWGDGEILFNGFREQAELLGMACYLYQSKSGAAGETEEMRHRRRRREFIEWLKDVPKPVGILAAGGWFAATYCTWVAHEGLAVPSDVAVLSAGMRPQICESSMPTISAVEADDAARVAAGCDLLERMMAGESAPTEPILIPPRGVAERESTNVLATPDREVAAALRYMWDHLDMDLSVDRIAGEVGMSSRQLARRFHKALDRTPTEELLRKRLKETKHLLRSTELSIADLAPLVGFHSTTYLHRTFREAFGVTPAQYRRGVVA